MSLIRIIISLLIISSVADAREKKERDFIYYESEEYTCRFEAPEHWRFDLENARLDNYSAAMFPDSNEYYNADMIIYIQLFGLKKYTFRQFVTADSLAYLKDNPGLKFIKTDSVLNYRKENYIPYFETEDPGAGINIAFVGYIPAGNEIVIYEMNIKDRHIYSEAQARFREALAGFSIIEKKD